jgi:hypothetical protein
MEHNMNVVSTIILLEIYSLSDMTDQMHVQWDEVKCAGRVAKDLHEKGFIRITAAHVFEPKRSRYEVTQKGRVFIEALAKVPAPVNTWSIPE